MTPPTGSRARQTVGMIERAWAKGQEIVEVVPPPGP